jgi:hypothetical protein
MSKIYGQNVLSEIRNVLDNYTVVFPPFQSLMIIQHSTSTKKYVSNLSINGAICPCDSSTVVTLGILFFVFCFAKILVVR